MQTYVGEPEKELLERHLRFEKRKCRSVFVDKFRKSASVKFRRLNRPGLIQALEEVEQYVPYGVLVIDDWRSIAPTFEDGMSFLRRLCGRGIDDIVWLEVINQSELNIMSVKDKRIVEFVHFAAMYDQLSE